jgi:hypothetical protein
MGEFFGIKSPERKASPYFHSLISASLCLHAILALDIVPIRMSYFFLTL